MIRRAVATDLKTLIKITAACAADMKKRGIFQWNETYPNIAVFKKDLEDEALYVYAFQNSVVGCIMFQKKKRCFIIKSNGLPLMKKIYMFIG